VLMMTLLVSLPVRMSPSLSAMPVMSLLCIVSRLSGTTEVESGGRYVRAAAEPVTQRSVRSRICSRSRGTRRGAR
jgi:hypothetical protein